MNQTMSEQKIRQNLHTHSIYDDGKDTIEQMADTACKKGFTILGYSGHGYNHPLDPDSMTRENHIKYKEDIQRMKEKYAGKMDIYYGIEQDSMTRLDCSEYDYVIGSAHFLKKDGVAMPIDYSKERFEDLLSQMYGGDIQAMVKDYYKAVEEMMDWPEVDIVGHIDLITKYNEEEEYFQFDEPWYLEAACKAIDKGIENGKIFEMNTGAIARGYRKTPYPHQKLIQYLCRKGAKLCINTDCHNRDNLDLGISDCIKIAREAGFKALYTMDNGIFKETAIENFRE